MTDQLTLFGSTDTTLPKASPTREPTIAERFEAFHAANPHVLAELLRLARARLAAGAIRIGTKALWEECRTSLRASHAGDEWKLNNSYTALYGRKLIELEPKLEGVIEVRQRKAK